jgi:hypothetical protein
MSVFHGWHHHPPKKGGESLYTCPSKTSRWELFSKNWNIQNLKYSCCSSNRTIQFPWFSEMWSVCVHYISPISLGFLGYIEHWDFVGNPCGIPLDRATWLHSRLNIKYISSTWTFTTLIVATSLSFLLHEGCHMWSYFGHWLLEVVAWNNSNHMFIFHFWSLSHFISWFNKDWHLEICDSSWLDWFFGLNIHLPFSITSGTSMSRLLLALLWCMVHRDQVLVNLSSTTIMSHTSLHIFHRLILENLLLMIKLLP